MLTCTCENCGKTYQTYYDAKHKFCCRACGKEYTAKQNTRTCTVCGCDFVKNSTAKGTFCSHACYAKSLEGKRPHNYLSGPVEIECVICGKMFAAERFRIGIAKTCSYACSGKLRATNDKRTCVHCGKEFKVWKARKDSARFCSRKCQGEHYRGDNSPSWNSVELPCDYCGETISVPSHRIDLVEKHFCGLKCYGKWQSENRTGENNPTWRGGCSPYYGGNWMNQRRQAVDRDGHCCRSCGISEEEYGQQLDVHHITPLRLFDGDYESANQLSNLISLCATCHKKIEFGKLPLPVD